MPKAGKIAFFALLLLLAGGVITLAAKPDKTPPVISDLRTESVTDNSALVLWTTDEPADSDIKYGISPKTNINGPSDSTLALSHVIALSELAAETAYDFCVESRDAAHNKSQACGTFVTATTTPPPPPPAPVSVGSGGGARPSYAYVSGFAYPGAIVSVALRPLFWGAELTQETTAGSDGSFSAAFSSFPQGAYFFTVTAKDSSGVTSARKGFQFDFSAGDAPLTKEKIIMPPTVWPARETIAWGDDLQVFGNTVPGGGVLVEAGGVLYEAKSDEQGLYNILINTARFAPGKLSIRARSSLISAFGYDYSPSKTVVLTKNSFPKADLNADGKVDMVDFSVFLSNPSDLNGDGKVSAADVSIFLKAFAGMSY